MITNQVERTPHALTAGPGARAGHGRRDKCDEELAEEDDLASADLLAVDREDWPRLAVVLEVLFRVGERDGLAAAKVWLTEHGIAWRELTHAPRRALLRPLQRAPRVSRASRMKTDHFMTGER